MKLPELNTEQASRYTTESFRGYNHKRRIGDGEFYDINNMTNDNYPILSTRKKRRIYKDSRFRFASAMTEVGGNIYFIAKDTEIAEDDTLDSLLSGYHLYKNCEKVSEYAFKGGNKQIAVNGANLIIFPDKVIYNTVTGEFKQMGTLIDKGIVVLTAVKSDYTDAESKSEAAYIKVFFISTDNDVSQILSLWDTVDINLSAVFDALQKDDGISGTRTVVYKGDDGNVYIDGNMGEISQIWLAIGGSIGGIMFPDIATDTESNVQYFPYDDSDGTAAKFDGVSFCRKIPDMDYILERNNRLWGCKYGASADGAVVNEIYCSKEGEPDNFSVLQDYSNSAFTATIGTGGEFTGAYNYNGYALFFKKDCIIKVSGYFPSDFTVDVINCQGVDGNAYNSIAELHGYLLYKSANGIYRFDGASTECISDCFGDETYLWAVGAANGSKYYVSLVKSDVFAEINARADAKFEEVLAAMEGNPVAQLLARALKAVYVSIYRILLFANASSLANADMMIYDMATGLWLKESGSHILTMYSDKRNLYGIDADGRFICLEERDQNGHPGDMKARSEPENDFNWFAETGEIGYSYPDFKYISRFNIRASLSVTSRLDVWIMYDSSDNWERLYSIRNVGTRSFTLPIIPRRCDHLKLKFSGIGECHIYSVTRKIEQGSDR